MFDARGHRQTTHLTTTLSTLGAFSGLSAPFRGTTSFEISKNVCVRARAFVFETASAR